MGVSRSRVYLYRGTKGTEASPIAAAPNVSWKLLVPGEAARLSDIGYFDVNDCGERFGRGDVCYTASVDGRLAHYSWVQRSGVHPIIEAGISATVQPREFWIYHCMTAAWARGQKLYPATLHRIMQEHFGNGYERAWIYTIRENIASQNGIVRAGFEKVSELPALRVGSRYFRTGPPVMERVAR